MPSGEVSGLTAQDSDCCEGCVGFGDGVGEVDGAGCVFDDDGFEAEVVAVYCGVANAEVVGEADQEETLEVAFAEVAG